MDPLGERIAQLKRTAKAAAAIGLAVLDISPESQTEIMTVVLAVLPLSKSRDQLLLVAYDRGITTSYRDEQDRLVAERERRRAKAEAARAERARKKAAAEEEQVLFEAWKKSLAG